MQEAQETWIQSLGQEDPLEEETATHSSIIIWEIPWTDEPGRLQSMGSQSQIQLSTILEQTTLSQHLATYHEWSWPHSYPQGWSMISGPSQWDLATVHNRWPKSGQSGLAKVNSWTLFEQWENWTCSFLMNMNRKRLETGTATAISPPYKPKNSKIQ